MRADKANSEGKFRIRRHFRTVGILVLGVVISRVLVISAAERATSLQPILFNHRLHVEEVEEPCSTCHLYYQSREAAGRPSVAVCGDCHDEAMTDSLEEAKLVEFVEKNMELPWVRVTRMPRHVRFSHQRHTGTAQIDCGVCHGKIARMTEPPVKPLISIDMDFCIDCHRTLRYQISELSTKGLNRMGPGRHILEKIAQIQGRRFGSEPELLAAVEKITSAPLTDSDKEIILQQVDSTKSVDVDCIACHR